jgi:hypothetical protein
MHPATLNSNLLWTISLSYISNICLEKFRTWNLEMNLVRLAEINFGWIFRWICVETFYTCELSALTNRYKLCDIAASCHVTWGSSSQLIIVMFLRLYQSYRKEGLLCIFVHVNITFLQGCQWIQWMDLACSIMQMVLSVILPIHKCCYRVLHIGVCQ